MTTQSDSKMADINAKMQKAAAEGRTEAMLKLVNDGEFWCLGCTHSRIE